MRSADVAPGLPESFSCALVGMSFVRTYPGNVRVIERRLAENYWANPDAPEPVACLLRRNPGNEYDTNAIEIREDDGDMLGHLPRGVAARLTPEMDSGVRWSAVVTGVRTHPDNPDSPGVDVRLTRQPMVTGSTVDDLIRESVSEMKWGEVNYELATRSLPVPDDLGAMRAALAEVYIAERNTIMRERDGQ
jgi:hypothetical protein